MISGLDLCLFADDAFLFDSLKHDLQHTLGQFVQNVQLLIIQSLVKM